MNIKKIVKWTIITLVALILIAAIFGGTDNQKTSNSNSASTSSDKTEKMHIYKIGEPISVGERTYIVNSIKTAPAIGNEIFEEKASGIYLIVDLTIENIGKESGNFMSSDVTIYDDQDRKFQSATILGLKNALVFDQIQPGLKKTGNIAFDVPPGSKLRLKVSEGGFGSKAEYVDLGTI